MVSDLSCFFTPVNNNISDKYHKAVCRNKLGTRLYFLSKLFRENQASRFARADFHGKDFEAGSRAPVLVPAKRPSRVFEYRIL